MTLLLSLPSCLFALEILPTAMTFILTQLCTQTQIFYTSASPSFLLTLTAAFVISPSEPRRSVLSPLTI